MKISNIFKRVLLQEIGKYNETMKKRRPRKCSDEEILDLVFKLLRTGMQLRELDGPVHYANVTRRFKMWCVANVVENAYTKLLKTYTKLNKITRFCVDSSYTRNRCCHKKHMGRNHFDRGRFAFKTTTVCDQDRIVHGWMVHPGNRADVALLEESLASIVSDVKGIVAGQYEHDLIFV
ncbi:hypothetical protein EXVG_00398 [Emiliania huxleyi virus 202]|nr:hypothetical protein EXVG_00398 [Emiliania huxleyi virus 202]